MSANPATGSITPVSQRNLDGYGTPPIEWQRVYARLQQRIAQEPGGGGPGRHTCWLATVRPDGRPHVMPLGAIWDDGLFYFTSGPNTRKSKNLAFNPNCVLTVSTFDFDLVFEGEAVKVTDEPTLQHVARLFVDDGWPAEVRDGALIAEYSAPSAGPPPWEVYALKPKTVFALGTSEPYGATRYRF